MAPPEVAGPQVVGDGLVVFAASLLVGGLAIHAAARWLVSAGDYPDAVLTALLGALAFAVLDGFPVLGPVVALAGWVAVVKWRYPVGWLRAGVLGVAAWAAAVVAVAALELAGVGAIDALGVPGV